MTDIVLTWSEYAVAAGVGLSREVFSLARGQSTRDFHRPNDGSWLAFTNTHILGACGELAFCRAVDIHWPATINGYRREPDVRLASGPAEIRTASKAHGELIIRDDDDPTQIFVHVTGMPPAMSVVGWIRGEDARRDEWRSDPGGHGAPAWFIPSAALRPMTERP